MVRAAGFEPATPSVGMWQTDPNGLRQQSLKVGTGFFDDLDVLQQTGRVIVFVPGHPVVCLNSGNHRTENHARVGQLSDLAARQSNSKPLSDHVHESGFQLCVLNNSRRKTRRLAGRN